MKLRAAGILLVVAVVLGVLGVGAAAAVRATRGSSGRVVVKVTPGAGARGPAAPPSLSAVPRLSPPSGPTLATGPTGAAPAEPPVVEIPTPSAPSVAVGSASNGRLRNGVLFPAEGPDTTTWDALDQVSPNRDWRRVGTDRLVRTILTVAATFRRANPGAPRVVVSDLSLPQGGHFGPEYGGLGHASHQNGLDVDIAYPRRDGREVGVNRWSEADEQLAQSLVNAFVKAGAQYVFVGPSTKLKGPRGVVQALANHDDHLHVRLPNR